MQTRKRATGNRFDYDAIRKAVKVDGMTHKQAMAAFGCSHPTILRATRSGSTMGPGHANRSLVLKPDHPAVVGARSFFQKSLRDVSEDSVVLKTGDYSGKLGGMVTKGRLKGFPIFTIKLEERATCPATCLQWRACYGNNMPFAHRFRHGPALERKIRLEVGELSRRHPRGFLVRLHDLGDFYSVPYVALWGALLQRHPRLHVFGYTARSDLARDPIARAVRALTLLHWPRFAMRWSDGNSPYKTTIAIKTIADKPKDAVICPAQLQKVSRCGACGICWSTEKRVAFLQH